MTNLKKLFSPPTVVYYWLAFILWAILFMAVFRLLFLFKHWRLAEGIPVSEFLNSFMYGAKFDLVIIGYVVLPFLLISFLPIIGFDYSRLTRKIIQPILYFLFAIIFLLSLIDIEYFGEFGDHLGVWFYTYLDSFDMIWYIISKSFPVVWYAIAWILLTGVFIFIAHKFNRAFKPQHKNNIITRFVYLIIFLALMAYGIRGSVSLAALDWGYAYHSNYYFTNELSLNGIFTLSRSLYEYHDDTSRHNPSRYKFFDHQTALKTVQDIVALPGDSLLEPERSLKRKTNYTNADSIKQNVVIIIMESWSARFVGALGGAPDGVTPFFDSLARKSLLFDNLYASGLRTNRGLLSVLCSFPSLPGRTVMKLYGSTHPFISIAEILKDRGYDSHFIYGGDLGFDNMGGFFRMKGFENFIGIDDFDYNDRLNKWGIPDHEVLEKANEVFSETYPQPFLGVILTLSNHRPFALPDKRFEIFSPDIDHYDHLNAFHYSDWALGHFFHLAEQEEYFTNTIFVLVSDHGQMLSHPNKILTNFRIASLIYCPGRADIEPQRVRTICGQVDLLPTILGLLKLPVVHECWGRDILNLDPHDNGFAFINKGDTYGWIQDTLLFWEKVNVQTQLFKRQNHSIEPVDLSEKFPDVARSMQHKGRAVLQLEVEMVHDNKLKRDY